MTANCIMYSENGLLDTTNFSISFRNLLYLQSFRETFEHQLEEGRLRQALERINNQKMIWRNCEKPTPFSFPIITDRLREKLSSEKLEDRIRKMMKSLDS